MSLRNHWAPCGLAVLMLLAPAAQAVEGTGEKQSIEELRNTVINLLKALVDKGMLTHEQAELLVKQAQDKAATDAASAAAKDGVSHDVRAAVRDRVRIECQDRAVEHARRAPSIQLVPPGGLVPNAGN